MMKSAPDSSPLRPRRISVFDTVLRDIVWETHDTVTLVLDAGDHPRDYRAGQFISIDPGQFRELKQQIAYFEKAKGRREAVRAYSMASTPDEPWLAVTVKEEEYIEGDTDYPPLLSPLLVHGLEKGRTITVKGYSGHYHLPPNLPEVTRHVVHVVAGSGVVPNFAMVKWALANEPDVRHTFVYSNKTWNDVIFARQLAELEASSGGRLRLVHCLTRESEVPAACVGGRLGRIDRSVLEEVIDDPQGCLVYACGTAITRWDKRKARERGEEPRPRFLEAVKAALAELGVPRERIHTEAY